jgi:hypothetical protein
VRRVLGAFALVASAVLAVVATFPPWFRWVFSAGGGDPFIQEQSGWERRSIPSRPTTREI